MLSHQHVDALNRFLHTTYGRERACRLVQYFSRFYVFYLTRHGAPAADIQRWTDLKNHVSNARKFFRLLKPVEFAQTGLKSLGTTDEVLRATGFLKQLGMFLYYSAEVFVLLLDLVASLVAGLYKFQLLGIRAHILAKERTAAIQGEKGIDADLKAREKHRATYQFVQDALDCVIPSSALGMLPVDEGFVGLVGIVTSLICMNTQWSSVNP
ncbi:peroxisomal biogenesis factor 11-domain-containing protein [Gongronella butleri]|nr:peroxisomal biogenesis factor 11-domain-containing protein [Gongronella butleri]